MVRAASRAPKAGSSGRFGKGPGTSALTRIFVRPQFGGEMAGQLQQRRLGGAVMKRALAFRARHRSGASGATLPYMEAILIDARLAAAGHALFQRGQRRAHRLEGGGHAAGIGRREILRRQRRKRL